MKNLAPRGGRTLLIGYTLVLIMVLVLAFRTEQTIAAVLGGGQPPKVVAKEESAGTRILAEIERRYEQIAHALPALRDPFRDPPALQAKPAAPKQAKPAETDESQGPVFPTVRAIVYDQGNPSVRLVLGDQASGWLRKGDIFHGWLVTQITPQSVRVERDGNSYQIKAY